MPCTYYTPQEEASIAQQDARDLKAKLDEVTALLCGVCDKIERGFDLRYEEYPELDTWRAEHLKMDAKRLKDEAAAKAKRNRAKAKKAKTTRLRNAALKKLSAEERSALGLKQVRDYYSK